MHREHVVHPYHNKYNCYPKTTWIKLKSIMLSKSSQTQKTTHSMTVCIWNSRKDKTIGIDSKIWKLGARGNMRKFSAVTEMFHVMTVEVVRGIHTFVTTKNWVNFILCKLYLDKAAFKKRYLENSIKPQRVLSSLLGKVWESFRKRWDVNWISSHNLRHNFKVPNSRKHSM